MIGRRMTRRGLFATGAKAGLCGAGAHILPRSVGQAWAQDLGPGMIGGPAGFAGAKPHQYGPDTPEGRAIKAAGAMKGNGTAPARIVPDQSLRALLHGQLAFRPDAVVAISADPAQVHVFGRSDERLAG